MFRKFPESHFNRSLRVEPNTSNSENSSQSSEIEICEHIVDPVKDTSDAERFNLSRKVFVGNINKLISLRKLKSFFLKFGLVEYVYMVKDHITHRFKGIAFVTFASRESVLKALKATDDELELDGRVLRIAEAEVSKRVSIVERGYDHTQNSVPTVKSKTDENWEEDLNDATQSLSAKVSVEHDKETESQAITTDAASLSQCIPLNQDVLCLIFSYLSIMERIRVERVCKQWQAASKQSWSRISLLHFRNMFQRFGGLTDATLASILHRCGQYLLCLDLSASPRLLTDMSLEVIGETCTKLERLNLTGVEVSDVSLRKLSQRCSTLKEVTLQKCFHIKNKGISWLLEGCKGLESLDLHGNQSINGDCFTSSSASLRDLRLNECFKLSDAGVYKISKHCPNLCHLEIGSCSKLTDRSLSHISTCANMEYLKIDNLPNVTTSALMDMFGKTWYNLARLSMAQNSAVNDAVLRMVAENCRKLRFLNISCCHQYVTDIGMFHLAKCPQLAHLDISYNYKLEDDGIEAVAAKGKLTHFIAKACSGITDEGIVHLADLCSLLEVVDLSGNINITNASSSAFAVWQMERYSPMHKLLLNLGGTRFDPDDCDSMVDPDYIEVCTQDWSQVHLRGDREIILPREESEDEEEGEEVKDAEMQGQGYPTISELVGMAAGAEIDDDYRWDEFEEDYGDDDDFLHGDDPLAMERWQLS